MANLTLPLELGMIESVHPAKTGNRWVFLLQDAHSVPEAQKSLQSLVQYFQKNFGVNLVALEGASGKLDATLFKSFPDPEKLKAVFNDYLNRGELSGAAAASVLSPYPGRYYGVENSELYEKAVEAFLESLPLRPVMRERAEKIRNESEKLKQRYYSSELKSLDEKQYQFEENDESFTELLTELSRHIPAEAKARAGFQAAYPHLALILEEFSQNESDKEALDREAREIMPRIHGALNESKKKELQAKWHAFQSGQTNAEIYLAEMMELSLREKIPVSFSSQARRQIERYNAIHHMRGWELFDELRGFSGSAFSNLAQTEEAKGLVKLSSELALLNRLAVTKLTRKDWDELNVQSPAAETPDSLRGIAREIAELRNELTANYPAYRFYQISCERDLHITKNLSRLMDSEKRESAVLVTGGFHTAALGEMLSRENISYAVVLPKVSQVPEESVYENHMKGKVSWQKFIKPENGRINIYDAFTRAASEKLLKGIGYGVSGIEDPTPYTPNPNLLKHWRDQLIRNLSRDKRISEARAYTGILDRLTWEGMGDSERKLIEKQWNEKLNRLVETLEAHKNEKDWSGAKVMDLMGKTTATAWTAIPFVPGRIYTERFLPASRISAASFSASAKSEVRESPKIIKMKLGETTDAVSWYRLIGDLREAAPEGSFQIRVKLDHGIEAEIPMHEAAFNVSKESAYRYLASWVYNLSIIYGTSSVGVQANTRKMMKKAVANFGGLIAQVYPGTSSSIARLAPLYLDDAYVSRQLGDLLNGELGNVRETLGEITHSPYGVSSYANAGKKVEIVPFDVIASERSERGNLGFGKQIPQQKARFAMTAQEPKNAKGIYLGIDVGGGSSKWGLLVDGVFHPLPEELKNQKTVVETHENGSQYVLRMAQHAQKVQLWVRENLGREVDGVGIVMPGAADIPNNRMATLGQIPTPTVKNWTDQDIQSVWQLTPDVAHALKISPDKVIVRNDMDGVLSGVAALLPKIRPYFWEKTKGNFAFNWMGTGHGFQYAVNGKPYPGPTEAGHMIVNFGKPGENIYDTEAFTSIPNLIHTAKGLGFAQNLGEVKPIGDAAADTSHRLHYQALRVFNEQFAYSFARNVAVNYLLSQMTGKTNGTQVLLGGGIARGTTGPILRDLTLKQLETLGFGGKIHIEILPEEEVTKTIKDPNDFGALGAASLIRDYVQAARSDLRSISETRRVEPEVPRSEVRSAKPLVIGVHYYEGDPNDANHRTYYPDWWVMHVLGQEILSQLGMGKDSVTVRDIKEKVLDRIKGLGFKGHRYSEATLKKLLDRMVDEYQLLRRAGEAYALAVDAQTLMIQVNAVEQIKTLFEKVLNKLSAGEKSATEELGSLLINFAATVIQWELYTVEAAWPVLKAVSLLSSERRDQLAAFLKSKKISELAEIPLVDSIRYLLTNQNIKDWLKTFAPHLVDRAIYYISPETWLAAGGLGRVGQYHTLAAKLLMEENARLITIEPKYSHRVKLTRSNQGEWTETKEKTVNYLQLPIPVNDKPWTEFDIYVSKNGKRTKITVEVSRGMNSRGVEVFLYRDKPEKEGEEAYFTEVLYGYQNTKNPMFQNAVHVAEFTEFASKVSLKIAKKIEYENQRDGKTKHPPVLWANDGQTALLPLFKLISDDLERMSPQERERILYDPSHPCHEYRDLIREEGEVSLLDAMVHQTTHTYRNRMIWGLKELIENLKLPNRYHGYLQSGEWLYLGDPSYETASDATSAGLRAAHADLGGKNGVAAIHAQEVNPLDRGVDLTGNTNGDDREATRWEWHKIFEETAFKTAFPNEDSENPSVLAFVTAKRKAKNLIRENASLLQLNPRFADLDPDKIVYIYTGRGVVEKVGRTRANTDENIADIIRNGGQFIFLANAQPGHEESKKIFSELKELEDRLYAERATAIAEGRSFGLFVAATGWGPPEQRVVLAGADVQVNDSDRDKKRGTEAAGVTETDVMATGGLELTSPFLEAIFHTQGIMVNWDIDGWGNTIIPESSDPAAYREAMLRTLREYQKDRNRFALYQITSIRLSRILAAYFAASGYLRGINKTISQKNNPNFIWDLYFASQKDPKQAHAGWWKDFTRRLFDRLWEKHISDSAGDQKFLDSLEYSLEDAAKVFSLKAFQYDWWEDNNRIGASDPGIPGLIGMMKTLNEKDPDKLLKALEHSAKGGYLFTYADLALKKVSSSANPLRAEIARLKKLAEATNNLDEKVKINLLLLKRLSQYSRYLAVSAFEGHYEAPASELYENYGREEVKKFPKLTALGRMHQNIAYNPHYARLVADYLQDERQDTLPFSSDNPAVVSFLLDANRDPVLVSLDMGFIRYPDSSEGIEEKAWAHLPWRGQFKKYADKHLTAPRHGVQVYDEKKGVGYRSYPEGVPIDLGVAGIQFLTLKLERVPTSKTADPQSAKAKWRDVKPRILQLRDTALNKQNQNREVELNAMLPTEQKAAEQLYPPAYFTRVMMLVAMWAPDFLKNTEKWNPAFYQKLKETVIDNTLNREVLQSGAAAFAQPGRSDNVFTFYVTLNGSEGFNSGRNLILHVDFELETRNLESGKSWDAVRGIKGFDPDKIYHIKSLLTGRQFNAKTGQHLSDRWDIGVPIENIAVDDEIVQEGFGGDLYQVLAYAPPFFKKEQLPLAAPVIASDAQMLSLHLDEYASKAGMRQFENFPETDLDAMRQAGLNTLILKGAFGPIASPAARALRNTNAATGGVEPVRVSDFLFRQDQGGDNSFDALVLRAKEKGIRIVVEFNAEAFYRENASMSFTKNTAETANALINEHPDWFIHRTTPPPDEERGLYFDHKLPSGQWIWVARARKATEKNENGNGNPYIIIAGSAQLNYLNPEVWQYMAERLLYLAKLTKNGGVIFNTSLLTRFDDYQAWFSKITPADFRNHMHAIAQTVFGEQVDEKGNVFGPLFSFIKKRHPDFLIIGEIEERLPGEPEGQHRYWQSLGVDLTYANYIYHWLAENKDGGFESFKRYLFDLKVDPQYLARSVYLLENPGSLATILEALRQQFPNKVTIDAEVLERAKLVAAAVATMPGVTEVRLTHELGRSWFSPFSVQNGLEKEYEAFEQYIRDLFTKTSLPVWRRGSRPEEIPHKGGNGGLLAFVRRHEGEAGVVVLNHSGETVTVDIDLSLIGQGKVTKILKPWETFIDVVEVKSVYRSEVRTIPAAAPSNAWDQIRAEEWELFKELTEEYVKDAQLMSLVNRDPSARLRSLEDIGNFLLSDVVPALERNKSMNRQTWMRLLIETNETGLDLLIRSAFEQKTDAGYEKAIDLAVRLLRSNEGTSSRIRRSVFTYMFKAFSAMKLKRHMAAAALSFLSIEDLSPEERTARVLDIFNLSFERGERDLDEARFIMDQAYQVVPFIRGNTQFLAESKLKFLLGLSYTAMVLSEAETMANVRTILEEFYQSEKLVIGNNANILVSYANLTKNLVMKVMPEDPERAQNIINDFRSKLPSMITNFREQLDALSANNAAGIAADMEVFLSSFINLAARNYAGAEKEIAQVLESGKLKMSPAYADWFYALAMQDKKQEAREALKKYIAKLIVPGEAGMPPELNYRYLVPLPEQQDQITGEYMVELLMDPAAWPRDASFIEAVTSLSVSRGWMTRETIADIFEKLGSAEGGVKSFYDQHEAEFKPLVAGFIRGIPMRGATHHVEFLWRYVHSLGEDRYLFSKSLLEMISHLMKDNYAAQRAALIKQTVQYFQLESGVLLNPFVRKFFLSNFIDSLAQWEIETSQYDPAAGLKLIDDLNEEMRKKIDPSVYLTTYYYRAVFMAIANHYRFIRDRSGQLPVTLKNLKAKLESFIKNYDRRYAKQIDKVVKDTADWPLALYLYGALAYLFYPHSDAPAKEGFKIFKEHFLLPADQEGRRRINFEDANAQGSAHQVIASLMPILTTQLENAVSAGDAAQKNELLEWFRQIFAKSFDLMDQSNELKEFLLLRVVSDFLSKKSRRFWYEVFYQKDHAASQELKIAVRKLIANEIDHNKQLEAPGIFLISSVLGDREISARGVREYISMNPENVMDGQSVILILTNFVLEFAEAVNEGDSQTAGEIRAVFPLWTDRARKLYDEEKESSEALKRYEKSSETEGVFHAVDKNYEKAADIFEKIYRDKVEGFEPVQYYFAILLAVTHQLNGDAAKAALWMERSIVMLNPELGNTDKNSRSGHFKAMEAEFYSLAFLIPPRMLELGAKQYAEFLFDSDKINKKEVFDEVLWKAEILSQPVAQTGIYRLMKQVVDEKKPFEQKHLWLMEWLGKSTVPKAEVLTLAESLERYMGELASKTKSKKYKGHLRSLAKMQTELKAKFGPEDLLKGVADLVTRGEYGAALKLITDFLKKNGKDSRGEEKFAELIAQQKTIEGLKAGFEAIDAALKSGNIDEAERLAAEIEKKYLTHKDLIQIKADLSLLREAGTHLKQGNLSLARGALETGAGTDKSGNIKFFIEKIQAAGKDLEKVSGLLEARAYQAARKSLREILLNIKNIFQVPPGTNGGEIGGIVKAINEMQRDLNEVKAFAADKPVSFFSNRKAAFPVFAKKVLELAEYPEHKEEVLPLILKRAADLFNSENYYLAFDVARLVHEFESLPGSENAAAKANEIMNQAAAHIWLPGLENDLWIISAKLEAQDARAEREGQEAKSQFSFDQNDYVIKEGKLILRNVQFKNGSRRWTPAKAEDFLFGDSFKITPNAAPAPEKIAHPKAMPGYFKIINFESATEDTTNQIEFELPKTLEEADTQKKQIEEALQNGGVLKRGKRPVERIQRDTLIHVVQDIRKNLRDQISPADTPYEPVTTGNRFMDLLLGFKLHLEEQSVTSKGHELVHNKWIQDTEAAIRKSSETLQNFKFDPPQREALIAMLGDKYPIVFIQGPPGTGKTATTAAGLQIIKTKLNGRSFVMSQQNHAVDNILLKLIDLLTKMNLPKDNIVRVANEVSGITQQALKDLWAIKRQLLEAIHAEPSKGAVIGGGSNGMFLDKDLRKFEHLLTGNEKVLLFMDEASRAFVTETLTPLDVLGPAIRRLILFGDHFQLGPTAITEEDIESIVIELGGWKKTSKPKPGDFKRLMQARFAIEGLGTKSLEEIFSYKAISQMKRSLFELTLDLFLGADTEEKVFKRTRPAFFFFDQNRRSVKRIVRGFSPFYTNRGRKLEAMREEDGFFMVDDTAGKSPEYRRSVSGMTAGENGTNGPFGRNLSFANNGEVDRVIYWLNDFINHKGLDPSKPNQIAVITSYRGQEGAIHQAVTGFAQIHAWLKELKTSGKSSVFRANTLSAGYVQRRIRTYVIDTLLKGQPQGKRQIEAAVSSINQEFSQLSMKKSVEPQEIDRFYKILGLGERFVTLSDIEKKTFEIVTTDTSIGNEWKGVIASWVRSNSEAEVGFLRRFQRRNVLGSRATDFYVQIGDFSGTLTQTKDQAFNGWGRLQMRISSETEQDIINEVDFTLKRSEIRKQAKNFLTGFAARGGQLVLENAEGLARLLRVFGAEDVAYAMRKEGRNPRYPEILSGVSIYADYRAQSDFIKDHTDYWKKRDQFMRYTVERTRSQAHAYLQSNADQKLAFAFAYRVGADTSKTLQKDLLSSIRLVKALKAEYPSRVNGNIKILMPSFLTKADAFIPFIKEIEGSGVAKILWLDQPGAQNELGRYLNDNPNAMVYGRFDSGLVPEKLAYRYVDSKVSLEAAFPVTLAVTAGLATTPNIEAAELRKALPHLLPRVIRFNGTSFEITSAALELVYHEHQVEQLLARMA